MPAAPLFDPLVFFAGTLHGEARLKVLFQPGKAITVESRGRVEDGVLVLDQTVREDGQPARERQWRIRATTPGHYAGTLSDAAGPVTGEARGSLLILRFPMKGGLDAVQWLRLAPDGRSAENRLVVRKLGLTLAVLEERIAKRGETAPR